MPNTFVSEQEAQLLKKLAILKNAKEDEQLAFRLRNEADEKWQVRYQNAKRLADEVYDLVNEMTTYGKP